MQGRIEARYRREHADQPVLLNSPEDVDILIDNLLAGSAGQNLAQLHSLERQLLPSGYPDHELLVGAKGAFDVGVLAFMDGSGNVVTLGSSDDEGDVFYSIMGNATEFPSSSQIPVDILRKAVKEFLSSGGQRPKCANWQVPDTW
jgi:hypothetical protein